MRDATTSRGGRLLMPAHTVMPSPLMRLVLTTMSIAWLGACEQRPASRPAAMDDRSTATAVPADAGPIDAAQVDADVAISAPDQDDRGDEVLRRLVASATHADAGAEVDGTRLGAVVEVRLAKRYDEKNGSMQHVVALLIVSGDGAVVVGVDNLGEDGMDEPSGTLVSIRPHDPLWGAPDASLDVRLPVRGAVLFGASFHIPGGDDHVAVIHRRDRLQVYSFWEDEGERADAWALRADVRLARRARVVVR